MTAITEQTHLTDAKGRLVPLPTIAPIDLARNDLVNEMVTKAKDLQEQIRTHRSQAFGDIQAFADMSAEQYDKTIGGSKGNISLVSYDGCKKVVRSIQDYIVFDERLQAAKALIDRCLHRWSDDAGNEIKVLVMDAFQVDQQGKISTGKVLGLRRHKFSDQEWTRAMEAISDSVQVASSKAFVRYYERQTPEDDWQPISLDIAKV